MGRSTETLHRQAAHIEQQATKHITNLHISLTPDKEIKKALKKIRFEKYVPGKD